MNHDDWMRILDKFSSVLLHLWNSVEPKLSDAENKKVLRKIEIFAESSTEKHTLRNYEDEDMEKQPLKQQQQLESKEASHDERDALQMEEANQTVN